MSVGDGCVSTFEEIRDQKMHRYIVFHITDDDDVINIQAVGESNISSF